MKAALLQLTSSDDPEANAEAVSAMIAEAAGQGATLIATPEVTNCVSRDRAHQREVLRWEEADPVRMAARDAAVTHGVWVALGSLAVRVEAEERFANRSILISPEGTVAARYEKIHMFDVEVSPEETFRESAAFRPGTRAVVAQAGEACLGLSVCYDLRFPQLYRALAKAGAEVLMIPAAFSPVTGKAHWEVLLRARAIETGCFVLAAAQTGTHPAAAGKPRRTWGHSMAVAPWGEVIADAGEAPGVTVVDLDLAQVAESRRRVPSLTHDREFETP